MGQIFNMWQIDKDVANWNSGGNSHNVNLIQISKYAPNSKMPQIEIWGKLAKRCCKLIYILGPQIYHICHRKIGGGTFEPMMRPDWESGKLIIDWKHLFRLWQFLKVLEMSKTP